MLKISFLNIWICFCTFEINSAFLIIPEEIMSLGPPIYSQVPTVHAGTDSRFGWGFRLGRYADFQVMVELGPQTYTQPIYQENKASGSSNSFKRSITNNIGYNTRKKTLSGYQGSGKGTNVNSVKTVSELVQRWRKGTKKREKNSVIEEKPSKKF